ncbi:hypothetical protein SCHPADRAFT_903072 [Schizopora paradoxa]|uniref:Uncharacterized protein n=1 Tax=Schizopora paradoxa TaxID=27342 RepID=A0A0H2RS32_9AGAM|nr:hypothetical protein SCHPADRAFT_903072 [Schizopora paradoxa]
MEIVSIFALFTFATIIVIYSLRALLSNLREIGLEIINSLELRLSFSTRNRRFSRIASSDDTPHSDLEARNMAMPGLVGLATENREHND